MNRCPERLLLEVATIVSNRAEPFNGNRRYVATGGLDGGELVESDEVGYETKPSRANLIAREGDVLFARMQATNKVLLITEETQNYIWSSGFAALRPGPNIRSRYLMHYLASPLFQITKDANCTGATQKSLPNGGLKKLAIPLIPLSQQDTIIEILDEAEELGKLRIQADRCTADLIPALFHEMFGGLTKNTSLWSSLPLGEVVNFGSGATPSKENPEFWNGQMPWVSPKDMKADEITDTEDHVSAAAFEKTNLQLIPKDTVLIVVRGMILAHTVPIRRCRVPVAINQDMKALLPKQSIEPEFLRWSLQAQHAHLLTQVSTAGHGTKKLDTEKLRAVTIPIPPLPLQKEFANHVTEIRKLQDEQAASRQRLDDLFQSCLHRAFNGEL